MCLGKIIESAKFDFLKSAHFLLIYRTYDYSHHFWSSNENVMIVLYEQFLQLSQKTSMREDCQLEFQHHLQNDPNPSLYFNNSLYALVNVTETVGYEILQQHKMIRFWKKKRKKLFFDHCSFLYQGTTRSLSNLLYTPCLFIDSNFAGQKPL